MPWPSLPKNCIRFTAFNSFVHEFNEECSTDEWKTVHELQVDRKSECKWNEATKFTKTDKRLYELYILFRIKLLLSAESKLRERIDDEIEKK